jgi:hypothetical protein
MNADRFLKPLALALALAGWGLAAGAASVDYAPGEKLAGKGLAFEENIPVVPGEEFYLDFSLALGPDTEVGQLAFDINYMPGVEFLPGQTTVTYTQSGGGSAISANLGFSGFFGLSGGPFDGIDGDTVHTPDANVTQLDTDGFNSDSLAYVAVADDFFSDPVAPVLDGQLTFELAFLLAATVEPETDLRVKLANLLVVDQASFDDLLDGLDDVKFTIGSSEATITAIPLPPAWLLALAAFGVLALRRRAG